MAISLDMAMAIGLAALYIADNPYSVPPPAVDTTKVYRMRRNTSAWA